jgi:hypothetical protein
MNRTTPYAIAAAAIIAAGTAWWFHEHQPRRPWPKPTPPPASSQIFFQVEEPMPTEEEIARDAAEHYARLEQNLEQAVTDTDAQRREDAFVFLLPELLQQEPQRVVDLVRRLPSGASRTWLRDEVARQWVDRDLPAAMRWMKTLDEAEARESAAAAATVLIPIEPGKAELLAREFGLPPATPLASLSQTSGNRTR